MSKCFWCGEDIDRHSIEHEVGGVKKPFHHGMWKDCLNDFIRWQRNRPEVPTLQLVERVRAARMVH